jgi:excinuclease ABC subunit C
VQQDVIAVAADATDAVVQVLHVRSGRIEGGGSYVLENSGGDPTEDIVEGFVTQHYEDGRAIPREILAEALGESREELAQWLRERRGAAVTLLSPQPGAKAALVAICQKERATRFSSASRTSRYATRKRRWPWRSCSPRSGCPRCRAHRGLRHLHHPGRAFRRLMVVFHRGMPAKKRTGTFASRRSRAQRLRLHGGGHRPALYPRRYGKGRREAAGLPPEEGRFTCSRT